MFAKRRLRLILLAIIMATGVHIGCESESVEPAHASEEAVHAALTPASTIPSDLSPHAVLSFPITLAGAIQAVQDLEFDAFVNESYRILLLRDPDSLWYSESGKARNLGLTDMVTFTDLSPEGLETTKQIQEAFRDQLLSYDRTALSPDQIITYDSYLWTLNDSLSLAEYPLWNICIGPGMYGLQGRLNDLLAALPVESIEDAEAYVQRLQGVDEWFVQWIDTLSIRESAGVIPPIYELEMSIMMLDNSLPTGEDGSLYPEAYHACTDFAEKVASLPDLTDQQQSDLLVAARDAVRDHVFPGFQALRAYYVQLQPHSGDTLGVSRYDGGDEYFAALVRHHATSDITVDEVYELGIEEVARLQAEMHRVAEDELGWPENMSMAEMSARLDQAKMPLLQGQRLIDEYERLLAEVDAVMDDAFSVYPTAGVEVRVDPEGCWACYAQPGSISDDMGYMMTNLANLGAFTQYDEPVLVHHESIPGHHYQIALAMDLTVPLLQGGRYRDDFYYIHPKAQAFSEGWALYAERLALDLGLYKGDPLAHLLSLRLWLARTARLVIQVGLHSERWTWNDVVAYQQDAVGIREGDNRQLFHISYPGQACSYSVLSLAILDIRQRAMDLLGDRFDLKEFHWELLRHGFIPLQVLEEVMDNWMNALAQS